MTQLRYDSRVEKALANLRAMGLNVNIIPDGNDEAFIFITLDSLLKLVERRIQFPNRKVYCEGKWIVVRVWRQG